MRNEKRREALTSWTIEQARDLMRRAAKQDQRHLNVRGDRARGDMYKKCDEIRNEAENLYLYSDKITQEEFKSLIEKSRYKWKEEIMEILGLEVS